MKKLTLLLALIAVVGLTAPPARADTMTCKAEGFPGYCLETLPKLHCCSAAFLGWSEIVVGDSFPVAGQVARIEGEPSVTGLRIEYPSGQTVSLPVGADGRFREMVAFSEEGAYRLFQITGDRTIEMGSFDVAYRAELVEGMLVESQFGAQHGRNALTTAMILADQPAALRVRFTNAQGEPVRSQTLALGFGEQRFTTDAEGMATITYDPGEKSDYQIERLYPGLALISYREISVDGLGRVSGLPGGEVTAVRENGRWYFPLKAFLEAASPMRFRDQVTWNGETRTVRVDGISIMIDTGLVLGYPDFRSDLWVLNGSTYMEMHSLIRLMDQLGMAQRTGEFGFRLSLAQEP